jgi:potassium/chloride transporter 9
VAVSSTLDSFFLSELTQDAAYYLISRSLGPEFGGSIGIVYYLGSVFNTSLNAVGLIDCLIENFGSHGGDMAEWLPQSYWWQFLWATLVLAVCTLICLAGSGLFARCSNGLLLVLLVATISIPLSAVVRPPFTNPKEEIVFTGLSMDTFRQNLLPHFTRGAAGSVGHHRENFQDLFGILFPATGGILAGASMSGDLKHPSKAIPKGTLYGIGLTFILYTLVIFAMAASIARETFYNNTNVIQLTNISGAVVLAGEMATSLFSVLMGVIGSAKLLQALARDHLIPGLSLFGQGTKKSDEPIYAIIITFIIAQITMFADINQIASFITMTYLMTFLVTNLACFLLKIGSAPNFRPSFHYFNWPTALIGTVACGATMFFVDGFYASGCVALLMIIFLLIHYTTPPKPWGDVSQGLIYHQVRKYLLRLRQEHVKFWRPQILLLVNDPRRQYKLIQFCNSLKKGGLFVLGHVIVSNDFGEAVPEARRQQQSWTKYIDFSRIKAFVNIAISPSVEWGARNLVLGAGLGGMRPNIVVMGFYNLPELRQAQPSIGIPSPQPSRPSSKAANHPVSRKAIQAAARRRVTGNTHSMLPTDAMKPESAVAIRSYVTVIEDLILRLQANVAIGKGFQELEVPPAKPTAKQKAFSFMGLSDIEIEDPSKKYIDLWPIQMSAEIATAGDEPVRKNVLTTNFDTYTLILQLGCILHTVPSWKRMYKLRVCVFVEYETDVEEERDRVTTLLRNLRIGKSSYTNCI